MGKIFKFTSCYLAVSIGFSSINGCAFLYNMETGITISDPALKPYVSDFNTTARTKIFYGDYFKLYRTDEALYLLTESNYNGETSRNLMGVNVKYDMLCGSSCNELIESLNAKSVEYNEQDATYEGGEKIFKLISDSSYFIFSAPQLYAGSATFEYLNNNQILKNQLAAYNLAKSENTPDGYKKFIAENQDNTYLIEKAKADLGILEPAISNEDNTGALIALGIVAAGIYGIGKLISGMVSGGDSGDSSDYSSSSSSSGSYGKTDCFGIRDSDNLKQLCLGTHEKTDCFGIRDDDNLQQLCLGTYNKTDCFGIRDNDNLKQLCLGIYEKTDCFGIQNDGNLRQLCLGKYNKTDCFGIRDNDNLKQLCLGWR